MNYLDTLEKLYIDFVLSTKQFPKKAVCNENTLDNILGEFWYRSFDIENGETKEGFKKRIKLEGVRYRGILIGVNNSVQDDIIYMQ